MAQEQRDQRSASAKQSSVIPPLARSNTPQTRPTRAPSDLHVFRLAAADHGRQNARPNRARRSRRGTARARRTTDWSACARSRTCRRGSGYHGHPARIPWDSSFSVRLQVAAFYHRLVMTVLPRSVAGAGEPTQRRAQGQGPEHAFTVTRSNASFRFAS